MPASPAPAHVRLPWTNDSALSPWMLAAPHVLDLAAGFRAHLGEPRFRERLEREVRARFVELDARPSLAGAELEELLRMARLLARLRNLDAEEDAAWDELVALLAEPQGGWYFRSSEAIPYPDADVDALLGRSEHGLPARFEVWLEENRPLSGHDHVVVPVEALGQLPFVDHLLRHAARSRTTVTLLDRCAAEPDLLGTFGFRVGRRALPDGEGRGASVRDQLIAVTWTPTAPGLASGKSTRELAEELGRWRRRGAEVALEVGVPVEALRSRGETALFAVLDTIQKVQWELFSLTVRLVERRGPVSPEAWMESWRWRSTRADLVRVQVDAELDHQDLAPHMRRYRSLLDPDVLLRAAPRSTLASRYPLDQLCLETAPVFSRPYGYGYATGPITFSLDAARRRTTYHLGSGARLILASRVERAILDAFTEPGSARAFLDGEGARLGVGPSDLETLVIEGNLIAPRVAPARPARASRLSRLSRRRPNTKGYLHFVGVGPTGEDGLDARAVRAIRDAPWLWLQDLGLPGTERTILRKHLGKQKILNTVFYYGAGQLRDVRRQSFYRLAVRRAIDLANQGVPVTMVFSGSPAVWVLAWQLARQYAELHPGFDLRLTNAMSFLDTVLAPTPLGGVAGSLQLRLGTLHEPCDVSPEIDCVLGQVGDTGQAWGIGTRPESTEATLARLYPPDHPVYVVGNDEIDGEPLYLETNARQVGEVVRQYARWYLCLVIPSLEHARVIRELAAHDQAQARLDYLIRG